MSNQSKPPSSVGPAGPPTSVESGEPINQEPTQEPTARLAAHYIPAPMRWAIRHLDSPISSLTLVIRDIGRVIKDNLHAKQEGTRPSIPEKIAHAISEAIHQIKGGKLEEASPKGYINYLGEKKVGLPPEAAAAKKARSQRPLSQFELKIIERFEEAKGIEKQAEDGMPHFLAKTIEEWRAFFQRFVSRLIGKSVELDNVHELLYRGVVKKGDLKGIVISDLTLATGKTEKFIRFSVLMEKIGEFLAKLIPGQVLLKQIVKDGIAGDKLRYLAIGPPTAEAEAATQLKPREGIFTGSALEERVAEELGIARDKGAPPTTTAEARASRGKRRASWFARLLWGEEEPEEAPGRFVPWWSWGNLTKPGGSTLKRAFYTALFIALILVMLFLIDRLLGGM